MKVALALGPDVIERLIPHRRPFLMVDGVVAYEGTPRPSPRTTPDSTAIKRGSGVRDSGPSLGKPEGAC